MPKRIRIEVHSDNGVTAELRVRKFHILGNVSRNQWVQAQITLQLLENFASIQSYEIQEPTIIIRRTALKRNWNGIQDKILEIIKEAVGWTGERVEIDFQFFDKIYPGSLNDFQVGELADKALAAVLKKSSATE